MLVCSDGGLGEGWQEMLTAWVFAVFRDGVIGDVGLVGVFRDGWGMKRLNWVLYI